MSEFLIKVAFQRGSSWQEFFQICCSQIFNCFARWASGKYYFEILSIISDTKVSRLNKIAQMSDTSNSFKHTISAEDVVAKYCG